MSGSDYSGWGGDDKGSPMVVVSPGSGDGGGGSSRTTFILLVTALVFALGIAGYTLVQQGTNNGKHKDEITALTNKHKDEIAALNQKLGIANSLVASENNSPAALVADNAALALNKSRALTVPAPLPTEHQLYVDDLRRENALRRKPSAGPVIATVRQNPWPKQPSPPT